MFEKEDAAERFSRGMQGRQFDPSIDRHRDTKSSQAHDSTLCPSFSGAHAHIPPIDQRNRRDDV